MIRKTYKANTHICLNVVLPSNANMHLSFVPLTNGSSVYTTEDENVQQGLERHYNFNRLFFLEESEEYEVGAEAENQGTKEVDDTDGGAADDGMTVVEVSDIAEAKNYLAEKFGVSRTLLKSSKAIAEQAAINGVRFEGLE